MISMGEMVPQDAEARVIDLFVEILPLDELCPSWVKVS
jgi:hypothetical protein